MKNVKDFEAFCESLSDNEKRTLLEILEEFDHCEKEKKECVS